MPVIVEPLFRAPAIAPPGPWVAAYSADRKQEWDGFVRTARNSTFLFERDYMDYHRDRFQDHSLMIYEDSRLVALLPANRDGDGVVVSHQGLTYGGLLLQRDATLKGVIQAFRQILAYLHEKGVTMLRYKQVPSFYCAQPNDDISYCLFLVNAHLYRRDCAQVIRMADRLPFQKRRKRQIARASRAELRIVPETSFGPFWNNVLTPRLEARYGVRPVHTATEIRLLASQFPDCIKQYSVYRDSEIIAGTTIYETPRVAHAQYIAASDEGRELGALDYLFAWLIDHRYFKKDCFDFGICNENEGRGINHGLLEWKEGFGARTYSHDFYEIATGNFFQLDRFLASETSS